ncbi:MAG TPA: DUF748 domain-containing protein [Candidatus Binatia bacterium]|nr:DUF748 domain-containing protein [Candidatus Binatia bacterium]
MGLQVLHRPKARRRTVVVEDRPRRIRRGWRALGLVLLILITLVVIARALLPNFVRDYVNRTLDKNPLYAGKIGPVDIHLLRGAYAIRDVRISKTTGNVPVPFFAARRMDFAIQWDALWHRKLVGRVVMDQPELNFVDAPSESEDQTGAGAPWLKMIEDLFPFRINQALVRNGAIHFRAFQTEKPVDIYMTDVEASIDNLTNIRDETKPLVSTVQATAIAMDHAKFEFKMTLDPFSYRPTFHMAMRLIGLDVTKLNDLARAYGKFDFERGWFDLVVEADAKEALIKGYAKPLFRDLKIFSLREDIKDENILQVFWQALVGGVTSLFKNHARDQFGTLVPFTGDLSQKTSADILATIGNVLRNAFVRAYLPRLEGGGEAVEGLQFAPAELSDPISVGDESK